MTSPAPFPPPRPFDFRDASEREYALLNAFHDAVHAEQAPDDPLTPHEERVRQWRGRPAFVEPFAWFVPDPEEAAIAAVGSTGWLRAEENAHLAEFHFEVLPTYRRRGLGRRLLGEIADTAERAGRRLLISATTDRVPAGAAFMERIGARAGLTSHINQLVLTELDHGAVRRWLAEGRAREGEFELGFWTGPFPEEDLAAIAALHDVMNQAPRGDLDAEDVRSTPEQLREAERSLAASGVERWVAYARERATGAFAGFSDVYWHPGQPALLEQGNTGVFPRYRNRGLGRWLKAAMLERILRGRPQVERIRTQNADSNAPMLRINTALGFRPYMARTVWQVETEKVRRYLDGRDSFHVIHQDRA